MQTQIITALLSVIFTLLAGRIVAWWHKPQVDWLLLPTTRFGTETRDGYNKEIFEKKFSENTDHVTTEVALYNAGDATAYDIRWIHPDGGNQFLAATMKPGDTRTFEYDVDADQYKTGTIAITYLSAPVRRSNVLRTEFACEHVGTQDHLKSNPEGALTRIRRSTPAAFRAVFR